MTISSDHIIAEFPPDGQDGSAFNVGDGIYLTVGHNIFTIDYKSNPASRSASDVIMSSTYGLLLDSGWKSYQDDLISNYLSHTHDSSISNDRNMGTIFAQSIPKDWVLINKSGDVNSSDPGLVVFLDSTDLYNPIFGLTGTTDDILVSRDGYRSNSSDGILSQSITYTHPGTGLPTTVNAPANSAFHDTPSDLATHGDSGTAIHIEFTKNALNMQNRAFVLGTVVSIRDETTGGTESGRPRFNYFSADDFSIVNASILTLSSQIGDVTTSEPTNLIVGSSQVDEVDGSFRADIILGRDGNDTIRDGDVTIPVAWAGDQIFGGFGDDVFFAWSGNDLLHGGDWRSYDGAGRTWSLENDGIDTAKYNDPLIDLVFKPKYTVWIGSTSGLPLWTFDSSPEALSDKTSAVYLSSDKPSGVGSSGVDTLISIEIIELGSQDDTIRLDNLSGAYLAGTDGKGGIAKIDMGENSTGPGKGDLIDASNLTSAVSIDLFGSLNNVRLRGDSSGESFLTILGAERVIGTTGNDVFEFEGLIPAGRNLHIDGGGGEHDVIDLKNSSDPNGINLYIVPGGSGSGYIESRKGNDPVGGKITFTRFHTDIVGSDYSDILSDESSGDHTIDAGDGDDKITVGGSGATIDGGAGNDVIHLKSASATIKFGAGGGHDVVNFDEADGDYDLALQGLDPNDVEIIAGGRDVYANFYEGEDGDGFHVQFIAVRIKSTGEMITFLENGKNIGPNGNGSAISYAVNSPKLDSISFGDGTVWMREGDMYFSGSPGVTWDFWGYKHEYPATNMEHYHTPDTYIDYVNTTYLRADPVSAPPPPPDQNLAGTSGDDDLKPGRGHDTVEGSAGNDRVRESQGDDTYKWNVGDGDDIIWGAGALDGFNTLELGVGISPADLQFAVSDDGAGLTITFVGQSGSVTLSGALVGDGFGIDQIRFADNTIMSRADLITAASSVISAAATTENGTSSADFIFAPAGNFVIDAGEDDDTIRVEGAGAGTFLFSSADGHDQIDDFGFGYSRNDTLQLTDANAAEVTLSRSGDSLIVTIISTGATVSINGHFKQDDGELHGVNTLKFADNTTWTRLQIRDTALGTESGTSPIAGTATAAVVEDGAIIRGTLVASDADDGDVLTFSLDDPIAGLAVAANGSWSFDATNAAYQHLSQGEELILTVNYRVADSAGLMSTSTLTLTLTGTSTMPLVEQELVNQRLADNAAFAYDVTGSFSDPEGDSLVFTAQVADGSELPTWLTLVDGQFEGTAPTGTSGVLNVVVTASNSALETSSAFRLHFGPDNEAPGVPVPLPNVTGGVDDPLDISVNSFVDADGDPVTLLSATLLDDTALPSWLSFEDGRLTGTPPIAAFGYTFDIKITATDGYDEGYAQFSITIGPRIITGTSGDDAFELSALFEVTGGLGSDLYTVTGDGGGVFYYSRGDGWDGIEQPDSGIRTDELIFTDISSDEITVFKYDSAVNLFIDDSNEFRAYWQFYGDSPGGVNQGFEHIQFADSITWDRDEIRNRANAPEIILDFSDPSETGSSASEAFVMEGGLGAGTIDDFEIAGANHDYLQFDRSQFDSWAHLLGATTQQGSDLVIDLGGGDSVTLTDVSMSAFTSLNVRFVGSASV